MHGGDLHYHLAQHGVFNEIDMKFYAAEVILGKYIVLNINKCTFIIKIIFYRFRTYAPKVYCL